MFLLPLLMPRIATPEAFPTLQFEKPSVQATLGAAFQDAVQNLVEINSVPFDPARYNDSGLLTGKLFVRAGGGYDQPWTRDAAINSWNAASLIEPGVARNTLWAVTKLDSHGKLIVQRDNQWWDKVIWIIAAWNHYKITGDREFLRTAFLVSKRLLAEQEASHFNSKFGLFMGPAFFNDGIAGYPSPPAAPDDSGSSFVLDHPGTDKLMALSTNCLYVEAYRTAVKMAAELGDSASNWSARANHLSAAINRRFWMPKAGRYGYLLDPQGKLDPSQEGSGSAFVVLFNIASPSRSRSELKHIVIEPHGIADVYPPFPRFSVAKPGRHNAIIWPMVEGMWARAAAKMRSESHFQFETENLAKLALGSGGHFEEIYNAATGQRDGGWQNGSHTDSQPDQTWSATAYINMITNGLFGMRFEPTGLTFQPLVPKAWGNATLTGVQYRGATLTIELKGTGSHVRSILLDGKKHSIPTILVGSHSIVISVR